MRAVNYPRFFNHFSRHYRHLNHVTTLKTFSLLIKTVLESRKPLRVQIYDTELKKITHPCPTGCSFAGWVRPAADTEKSRHT